MKKNEIHVFFELPSKECNFRSLKKQTRFIQQSCNADELTFFKLLFEGLDFLESIENLELTVDHVKRMKNSAQMMKSEVTQMDNSHETAQIMLEDLLKKIDESIDKDEVTFAIADVIDCIALILDSFCVT